MEAVEICSNEDLLKIANSMKKTAKMLSLIKIDEKPEFYAQSEEEVLARLKDPEYLKMSEKPISQKIIFVDDITVNMVLTIEEYGESYWHLSMSAVNTTGRTRFVNKGMPNLARVGGETATKIASAFFQEYSEMEHEGFLKEIRHFYSKVEN